MELLFFVVIGDIVLMGSIKSLFLNNFFLDATLLKLPAFYWLFLGPLPPLDSKFFLSLIITV